MTSHINDMGKDEVGQQVAGGLSQAKMPFPSEGSLCFTERGSFLFTQSVLIELHWLASTAGFCWSLLSWYQDYAVTPSFFKQVLGIKLWSSDLYIKHFTNQVSLQFLVVPFCICPSKLWVKDK